MTVPETNAGGSAGSRPTVFLHVGCRKSGTSFLQAALRESLPAMRSQGLDMPLETRPGHVNSLLLPLEKLVEEGNQGPIDRQLGKLVATIEKSGHPRSLITLEDLAELPQQAADVVLAALSRFDLHLVVTARHWAVAIPSEWQQNVKQRDTTPFGDFVAEVQHGSGANSDLYRARQDVPGIVERWGKGLAPDHLHVIAVPPSSRTEGNLTQLFCGLVGIDPESLTMPANPLNVSLGYVQAEMLRRVNVALGPRLADFRKEYRWAVRNWLTRGSLMKHDRTSIRLPDEFAPWCHEASQQQVDALQRVGVDIVGDPADLVSPAEGGGQFTEATEAEVAEMAIMALADLADLRWKEVNKAEAAKQRPANAGPPPPDHSGVRGRLRRVAEKLPEGVRERVPESVKERVRGR